MFFWEGATDQTSIRDRSDWFVVDSQRDVLKPAEFRTYFLNDQRRIVFVKYNPHGWISAPSSFVAYIFMN